MWIWCVHSQIVINSFVTANIYQMKIITVIINPAVYFYYLTTELPHNRSFSGSPTANEIIDDLAKKTLLGSSISRFLLLFEFWKQQSTLPHQAGDHAIMSPHRTNGLRSTLSRVWVPPKARPALLKRQCRKPSQGSVSVLLSGFGGAFTGINPTPSYIPLPIACLRGVPVHQRSKKNFSPQSVLVLRPLYFSSSISPSLWLPNFYRPFRGDTRMRHQSPSS